MAYKEIDTTSRDYYTRRLSSMKAERESFIAQYRELAEFIRPRRGRWFVSDRNKGDRRFNKIINSKATQAHRTARAGMLAGAASPARPWFSLSASDTDLMEFGPVKNWTHVVETQIRKVFNESNFYSMLAVLLDELLLFGTGAMTRLRDREDFSRFYTHTAGSYMIAQDETYRVRTLAREYEATVEQLISEFGYDNCSTFVRNAYDQGNYDVWVPVVHFVCPNKDRKPGSPMSQHKRFSSLYFEPGSSEKTFLKRMGFDRFPSYCPRWDLTGEDIYGTDCPAMTALGDIKGLQVQERRKAQGIDKMVNPPLHGPASLRTVPVSSMPGGLTVYDQTGDKDGLRPIYMVNPQLQELRLDMQAVEARIDTAFYVDMFLAISNMVGVQPKNEMELAQRNEERLLQLGPVMERIHGELLAPIVDDHFSEMVELSRDPQTGEWLDRAIIPPPPPELEGKPLKIDFISTLAMAQRAVAAGGIERVANFAMTLAGGGMTGALDKIDQDQIVDEYAGTIGVPPRIIVPDDVVAQRRAERMQAQRQAEMAQMANMNAQTAKTLADAKPDDSGDSALKKIAVGARQQLGQGNG